MTAPLTAPSALAIDIGASKMAAAVVSADGSMTRRHQVPTVGAADGDELWARLTKLIDVTLDGTTVDVCGVGCAGPMAQGGETVSPLNIDVWRGFPLRRRLVDRLDVPLSIANDGQALALGEGWLGAARGESNFIAMVVSTGVGGGIVIDDRLLLGSSGNAGHIGHMIVEPDGRRCACGARGCLEAEASGSAIFAAEGVEASLASPAVIQRTGTLVGRAVASVAHLLDLRLAVVAGSVALGFGLPFFAAAQLELDQRARLEFARGARIVPAGLGARGPLIGAARVGLLTIPTTAAGPGRQAAVEPG